MAGFEPATFGLEVRRAIHCATWTVILKQGFFFNCATGTVLVLWSKITLPFEFFKSGSPHKAEG